MVKPLVIFVGPPGSGKSSIARALSKKSGIGWRDSDHIINKHFGDINKIFEKYGQQYFRNLEKKIIKELIKKYSGIISLGGGSILESSTRELIKNYEVIFLDVDKEEAIERVSRNLSRPLLQKNTAEVWKKIEKERRQYYEMVAKHTINTSGMEIDTVVEIAKNCINHTFLGAKKSIPNNFLAATLSLKKEDCKPQKILKANKYDIIIGYNLSKKLLHYLKNHKTAKIIIIYSKPLLKEADSISNLLYKNEYKTFTIEVPDKENAKQAKVAIICWEMLGKYNIGRNDIIISLGGGTIIDLAGFVASTWMRGIKIIHIPTSIIGMVDAAIGGKNGINTSKGKNLVGSFYEPLAVLVDLNYLRTLSLNDLRSGLIESIKCGFIADEKILIILEQITYNIDIFSNKLFEVIYRSIQVKLNIVNKDYKENGVRQFLNYGHTLGHAIEYVENYNYRHGDAIAIGMMFAANLGYLIGKTSKELINRQHKILQKFGAPLKYSSKNWDLVFQAMKYDKKCYSNNLRFVVLENLNKPTIVESLDKSILFAAYKGVSE